MSANVAMPAIPGLAPMRSDVIEGVRADTGDAASSAPTSLDLASSFRDTLRDARELDQTATSQATKFANNDPSVGIHEVMIASEKANISLRYATTLTNKALEAYRELMGTQV